MTWQVEQAQDPPQAPLERVMLGYGWRRRRVYKGRRTFHFEVFGLGDVH